jgi:hypothetical protein
VVKYVKPVVVEIARTGVSARRKNQRSSEGKQQATHLLPP